MSDSLIKVFEKIRDIPYHIPESPTEVDCRCWGKNRKLLEEFKRSGYDARLIVCRFLWSKQKLPRELTIQAPLDNDTHPFVEIKIEDRWVKVDATLDREFPKYNKWDGKSDTPISIVYEEICSPEESNKINFEEDSSKKSKKWYLFWKKLNKFFDEMKINPKLVLLNDLIKKYSSDKERVEEWEKQGFSRRSYYDYKNILVQKCGEI